MISLACINQTRSITKIAGTDVSISLPALIQEEWISDYWRNALFMKGVFDEKAVF